MSSRHWAVAIAPWVLCGCEYLLSPPSGSPGSEASGGSTSVTPHVLISELFLYNWTTGGVDTQAKKRFIELYNPSDEPVSLADHFLANYPSYFLRLNAKPTDDDAISVKAMGVDLMVTSVHGVSFSARVASA
jgi:hypothetical protein